MNTQYLLDTCVKSNTLWNIYKSTQKKKIKLNYLYLNKYFSGMLYYENIYLNKKIIKSFINRVLTLES
jgi:hypothetical protein